MTADDLRAIVARDADGWSLGADADRRALLHLLRKIATVDCKECPWCGVLTADEHAPNCPTPLLEALR